MPPTTSRPGGRFRRVIPLVALVALALGAVAFVRVGSFLQREDPLQHADAVTVLAGSMMDRPLEAADLYKAGYAPLIVLSVDEPDGAVLFLAAHGVHFPRMVELVRNTLVTLGVPPTAIVIPKRLHNSTAQEAETLRTLARERGWRRMIVVTSKMHTRRAGFALRRELKGTGLDVVVRASRYDLARPEQWWRSRGDVRFVTIEVQKLVAYALGLGS